MNADSRVMEYFPLRSPSRNPPLSSTASAGNSKRKGSDSTPSNVARTGSCWVIRDFTGSRSTDRCTAGWKSAGDCAATCGATGMPRKRPEAVFITPACRNGIHYLFHRLEQSALTTGHATARYDTITGIRPPRTTNGTSSATARPVHDPDERIRRDRTGNPAGKPSIKPTTPSNLRAAAGKISRQRLALQYPKTLDQDRSTAQGTFRIFQQLSSPNIPSVKIANGSLSRPPGPNYEPEPYRKFDRANSPSYPNLVLPPKNRPGRSSDLMANQTVRSCKKRPWKNPQPFISE